ncbi:MAG TPA: DUF58 domain-containing protein [Nitriliruptorales bacterium]
MAVLKRKRREHAPADEVDLQGAAKAPTGLRLPTATKAPPRRRRFRERLDRLSESMSPRQLRRRVEQFQRKVGLTRYGQAAILAAVFLWLAAYLVAGTAMYLFAYGVVILLVVAYLVAPRRLKLEGERVGLFPRTQEGDRLAVTVKLTARKGVSTIVLEDRVPERLGTPARVPITKLSAGSSAEHHYGLRCTRRGVYQVGPMVAIGGDPLGLTQRETVIAEPFELLVHPRIELVSDRPLTRQFEDPPIRPPVSKPWPSGLEFYGMREYVPGDDLRRIVWRASARVGKLMVREAEQGITDRITIMLDTDRSGHSRDGEGLSESFEVGVRAAASLGVRHLREGYQVTVETNGGPLTRTLHGATNQLVLMDGLTRLEQSRQPLSTMIMRMLANGQRDAHNVLITPRLGQGEAAQLKLLLNSGVSLLVVALVWDDDNDTAARAASLGCQVAGLRPGDDLASALHHEIGAGMGRR